MTPMKKEKLRDKSRVFQVTLGITSPCRPSRTDQKCDTKVLLSVKISKMHCISKRMHHCRRDVSLSTGRQPRAHFYFASNRCVFPPSASVGQSADPTPLPSFLPLRIDRTPRRHYVRRPDVQVSQLRRKAGRASGGYVDRLM